MTLGYRIFEEHKQVLEKLPMEYDLRSRSLRHGRGQFVLVSGKAGHIGGHSRMTEPR